MANFDADIPEGVEHVFDHALGMSRRLVRPDKKQIDVTGGRQHIAAITAGRKDSEALALCRVAGAVDVYGDIVIERVQRLIHHRREQACRIETARALLQPLLRDHPTTEEARMKVVEDTFARLRLIRHVVEKGRCKFYPQRAAINDVGYVPLAGPAPGRQLAVDKGVALFAHEVLPSADVRSVTSFPASANRRQSGAAR